MKRNLLILVWVVFVVLFLFTQGWAQCPEDTLDSGECDTLYVEIYPPDQPPGYPAPFFVRFPIYITHDLVDLAQDSIHGFTIPLCYTHTNPSKYCSVSSYWNNLNVYPQADLDRSIFRHFIDGQDTVIHNWMMDLSQKPPPYGPNKEDWDTKIVDLGDQVSHFWLVSATSGSDDRRIEDGSRILLATMTFKLEDTMTICIDSCFWPPSARLKFGCGIMPTRNYTPRHNMPICELVHLPCPFPLYFTYCVDHQIHNTNGHFIRGDFVVEDKCDIFESVSADFHGEGVENVEILNVQYQGYYVIGQVAYDVTDHCQPGGFIRIIAVGQEGVTDTCKFDVYLCNNLPMGNLPDTWRALAGYSMRFEVSASDPDNDSVAIAMDAFWYEPDSLQPPTNPPSYDGGNPGFFTWVPAEADTGVWIGSFSVTDTCGAVDTQQATIMVGITYCGDCLEDALIDLGDLMHLISHLYKGGPSPDPPCKGDANCDGVVDLGDVLELINYLYKFGPAPCFECCAGVASTPLSKPQ